MYNKATIPAYVHAIHQETAQVKRFILAPVNGKSLPAFNGGSHITTYLPAQTGLLERHYSLIHDPDGQKEEYTTYHIAVRLSDASQGGSLYWHNHLKVGDQLLISYPRNHFQLSFSAKHHVFYAAGIGITPFLAMMAELNVKGASFELHYTSKSRETGAFIHLLEKHYERQTYFYFSEEGEKRRLTPNNLLDHPIGTHIYICGPESMITDFTQSALRFGYPASSIHFERFTPPRPKKRIPFQVELRDGKEIFVSTEQTLLEALLQAGVKAPYSCRVGRCGTCEVNVLAGEIDHYDSFLSDSEREAQRVMLTCSSRAKSKKLVLDL